jgi:hypothetical protein
LAHAFASAVVAFALALAFALAFAFAFAWPGGAVLADVTVAAGISIVAAIAAFDAHPTPASATASTTKSSSIA